MDKGELVWLGKKISSLCLKKETIFIVNDNPLLAKEVDADGVHLGQGDLNTYDLIQTRKILGKEKIIGVSTHSLSQFQKANGSNCDYIAFPIFQLNYIRNEFQSPKLPKRHKSVFCPKKKKDGREQRFLRKKF